MTMIVRLLSTALLLSLSENVFGFISTKSSRENSFAKLKLAADPVKAERVARSLLETRLQLEGKTIHHNRADPTEPVVHNGKATASQPLMNVAPVPPKKTKPVFPVSDPVKAEMVARSLLEARLKGSFKSASVAPTEEKMSASEVVQAEPVKTQAPKQVQLERESIISQVETKTPQTVSKTKQPFFSTTMSSEVTDDSYKKAYFIKTSDTEPTESEGLTGGVDIESLGAQLSGYFSSLESFGKELSGQLSSSIKEMFANSTEFGESGSLQAVGKQVVEEAKEIGDCFGLAASGVFKPTRRNIHTDKVTHRLALGSATRS